MATRKKKAKTRKRTSRERLEHHQHYLRGAALEEADARAARAAYAECLAGDCTHLNARINLGRLLHLEGLLEQAEAVYRAAAQRDSILLFNLGVLLEDRDKPRDAIEAYRAALAHDPGMADAHYNVSRLLEEAGERQAAFRHLLTYRRLTHPYGLGNDSGI
jgi:tetratricopeptide (TPR) repeat protein